MTTEGSAEVPAEQVMGVSEAWAYYRKEVAALGTWHDSAWAAQERALAAVVEYAIRAAERTRLEERLAACDREMSALSTDKNTLMTAVTHWRERAQAAEARLAEVEAERDEAREELGVMQFALDGTEQRFTALRAAVRPLVEAAGSARHYMRYGEGDPFQLVATIDAIMADPAIAALLEGGEK